MKIATWNVNSLRVRLPHLLDWLATAKPDVVGLQELKCEDHQFPTEALAEVGYQSVSHGQKTYNGVALLARQPLEDVQRGIPAFEDEQRRVIAARIGGIRVVKSFTNEEHERNLFREDNMRYRARKLDAYRIMAASQSLYAVHTATQGAGPA